MKMISTKAHGILDYLMAVLLITSPWLLGFAREGIETWIPVTFGMIALMYNWFTDYEYGVTPLMDMPVHLTIDMFMGLLLAFSPMIFEFDRYVSLPHVLLGALQSGIAIYTIQTPHKHTSHENELAN